LAIFQGVHWFAICRWQEAEVIQNHENANVWNPGQGEADSGNVRGLNLVAVKHTTVQVNRLPL
jgi:hypothetical protein